ncbi:MAG: trigger factor [Clostridia bacterium]|nr:trigger factor [Clostridia bacterium]
MLKSANKTETNTYTLEVSIGGEEFKAAIVKAYNKQKGKIAVPGFRKGKAPLSVIERYYGKGVFYEDALDILYPEVVGDAIKESGIEAVAAPYDVDVTKIDETGVEMTMKVTVKPEIEIGEYKGLKAVKADTTVSAADVKKKLEELQERNARLVTVEDRAVKKDDIAVIDFEGFVDGVAFDGGKGEGFELTIGSGQFIPGFEDQIIGHNAGEEFDVNVTFPAEYTPELAGKEAVFKVKVNEIKVKELPALDDEFAKDVSEDADTLAALKKSIKAELTEAKKAQADRDFESALLEQLAANVQGEIPEVMYDNKVEEEINNFAQRLAQQGLNLDGYLKYTGMDLDALKASFRDGAEKQVKLMLAVEKVVKLEGIEATDEEAEAKYAEMAEMYKMEAEQIKSFVPVEDIKTDIVNGKAVQLVVDNAVAEAAEKPAKKTAAKKTTKKAAEKKEEAAE